MPKRDNHIIKYKLKKGIRYKYKAYLGLDPLTQRKVERTKAGFTTYNDAKIAYDKAIAGGLDSIVRADRITINQLFDQWFASYINQVKPSTANKKLIAYNTHIRDTFGQKEPKSITTIMLQKYANKLATQLVKYSEPVLLLKALMQQAIILGYINTSPFKRFKMPRKTTRPRRDVSDNFYNKSDLKEFLAAASQYSKRVYTYFMLLASTGMRKSEGLALTWDDIHFDESYIDINKTLALGMHNKLIVQDPKSHKSKRHVPLSDNLKRCLLEYRKDETGFNKLFHTSDDQYLSLPKPRKWLLSIYKANPDLKQITLHGFRHTFASILIESNPRIKPTDVQAVMGHETVQMTLNIYTHVTDKGKDNIKNSLNNLDF